MTKAHKRDYGKINLDALDKDLEDYGVNERRKYIIDRMYEENYLFPAQLNYSNIAEKFDVSVETISNDADVIGKWLSEDLGEDEDNMAHAIYKNGAQKLYEEGQIMKAGRLLKMYAGWQERRGIKTPESDTADSGNVVVNLADEVIGDED